MFKIEQRCSVCSIDYLGFRRSIGARCHSGRLGTDGRNRQAMAIEDPELDALFRDDHPEMAYESRQAGRATGAGHERSYRTQHGGGAVTLRIKPDRRCLVSRVDPANERRRG
jgi:hypothetical protein